MIIALDHGSRIDLVSDEILSVRVPLKLAKSRNLLIINELHDLKAFSGHHCKYKVVNRHILRVEFRCLYSHS